MSRTPNFDAWKIDDSDVGMSLDSAVSADLSAIDAAHAEELERVRREAYRQGVEDSKSIGFLRLADSSIQVAKKCGARIRHARNQAEVSRLENHVFREIGNYEMFAKAAFNGARGIARVEIRQRLERLNKESRR